MGNRSSKSSLRNAIIYLNISADEISANDDKFWSQIFSENAAVADNVIKSITVQEIRMLRDGSPKNFATLAYKMVERLCLATGTLCNTQGQQTAVLNAVKILIRMLPCIFEDPLWRYFFELNSVSLSDGLRDQPRLRYPEKKQNERNYNAYVPVTTTTTTTRAGSRSAASSYDSNNQARGDESQKEPVGRRPGDDSLLGEPLLLPDNSYPAHGRPAEAELSPCGPNDERSLMRTLLLSICDLLFCPEFTVLSHGDSYLANAVDAPPEDLKSLSTYDYVWEPGVGFDSSVNSTTYYDKNRLELLRSLLVCLSVTMYERPKDSIRVRNNWMEVFVSKENRHALPLFTSLLNVVFSYRPPRPILQLNAILYENNRAQLVEVSCQLLIAVLDHNIESENKSNLFSDYMSRIHREEDLVFLIKGFIRLLKINTEQSRSWVSTRQMELDQELQVLLWRICNLNKKFIQFLLKSNDVLEVVVPILYHLNENFQEPSRTALIHMGVFNLLLLSSERNFGVRLNKQYSVHLLDNLPEFSGSHADLMILVFHKLIMYGYKINQLYDYLLTILVNVSPYLKGATILACKCLIQLFGTFSSMFVVLTEPNYHQLVVFLLEIFNNLIQYQFDGNTNLVYMILTKKELFLNLVNLPTTQKSIDKVLRRLSNQKRRLAQSDENLSGGGGKESNRLQTDDQADQDKKEEDSHSSDSSLATVSCSNNEVNSCKAPAKQEVSLVATPDLKHTTLPVHPFDFPNSASGNNQTVPGTADDKEPNISLDDLLGGLVESSAQAGSLTFDPTFDGNHKQRKQHEQLLGASECGSTSSLVPLGPTELGGARSRDETLGTSELPNGGNSSPGQSRAWRPTSGWLKEWKQSLPLETIHRMICALEPQLEQLRASKGKANDESDVIRFLQNGTLVGLLPVPHPIQIRKYRTNDGSTMWLRACTWGIIYVRSTIWTGTDIRLIKIL